LALLIVGFVGYVTVTRKDVLGEAPGASMLPGPAPHG
jgi:hypothetical protein